MNLSDLEDLWRQYIKQPLRISGTNHAMTRCLEPKEHASGIDTRPSMSVSFGGGKRSYVHCFGCGLKGRLTEVLFSLAGTYTGYYPAALTAQSLETVDFNSLDLDDISPPNPVEEIDYYQDLQELQEQYPNFSDEGEKFLFKKGVKLDVAKKAGVCEVPEGYTDDALGESNGSPRVMRAKTIILPFLVTTNSGTKCVGAAARSLEENPFSKYFMFYRFKAKGWLYPPPVLPKSRNKKIFLVEGYFDALHLIGLGQRAVAIHGTFLSPDMIHKIKAAKISQVLLALDPDVAGQEAAKNAYKALVSSGISTKLVTAKSDPKYWTQSQTKTYL